MNKINLPPKNPNNNNNRNNRNQVERFILVNQSKISEKKLFLRKITTQRKPLSKCYCFISIFFAHTQYKTTKGKNHGEIAFPVNVHFEPIYKFRTKHLKQNHFQTGKKS